MAMIEHTKSRRWIARDVACHVTRLHPPSTTVAGRHQWVDRTQSWNHMKQDSSHVNIFYQCYFERKCSVIDMSLLWQNENTSWVSFSHEMNNEQYCKTSTVHKTSAINKYTPVTYTAGVWTINITKVTSMPLTLESVSLHDHWPHIGNETVKTADVRTTKRQYYSRWYNSEMWPI